MKLPLLILMGLLPPLLAPASLSVSKNPASAAPSARDTVKTPTDTALLLRQIQYRAWLFFQEKTDARTGLAHDRARADGSDDYQIASMAATGYALAALPIAVEHGWLSRGEAEVRARRTLQFVLSMPNERGWMFHFVDARDGKRAWNSEVSTIDTALFALGALACGEYFRLSEPDIARDAEAIYARLDWNWARTNGGTQPHKQILTHGWKPKKLGGNFLRFNYGAYSEAIALVLLGLGAPHNPLPASTWDAIERPIEDFDGIQSLRAGPIFIHQMPHGFFPLRNRRDRLGWDYWVSSTNAMRSQRLFCERNASRRTTYARGFWGLNAGDGPRGYTAYGTPPSPEDGTVSPGGALASITFDQAEATKIALKMKSELGGKIWNRYGWSDAFNLDKNWFDSDVIGIDLGMALLAIENARTGLIWKLMQRQPWLGRAYKQAGLKVTRETSPRPLKK